MTTDTPIASPTTATASASRTADRPARPGTSPRSMVGALSLSQRFLLVNFLIFLFGGLVIGTWVGDQLQRRIIDRSGSITALYVSSFLQPSLESLAENDDWLPDQAVDELDRVVAESSLGDRIVSLKVWSPQGVVVYSSDAQLIGQSFPVEAGLARALAGDVVADLSDLEALENVSERGLADHLLEMYVPVRQQGSDRIIAVAEFYQAADELDREVNEARLGSWAVIAGALLLSYLVLYGIVKRASDTIDRQRAALQAQVGELSDLLVTNEALSTRVRSAAARTTTLNERSLRRISSDLHDGPGQTLALALLRMDALRQRTGTVDPSSPDDHAMVETALRDALGDMRTIAAGLRSPELSTMTVGEVAQRAVEDHRRRTKAEVRLSLGTLPDPLALPIKIALFRALQELLSNATRHGGKGAIDVDLDVVDDWLQLSVVDEGPGFDDDRVGQEGHLGLAGIREQAELLGGGFRIERDAANGATVRVRWPADR